MRKYIGITYPRIFQFRLIQWFWKKINCKRGMHLWDEVASDADHYLYCDACEMHINIQENT
jgi:hypothetical protein